MNLNAEQRASLVGFQRSAAWHAVLVLAEQILDQMKEEAFENSDDAAMRQARGAANFLELLKKNIEQVATKVA